MGVRVICQAEYLNLGFNRDLDDEGCTAIFGVLEAGSVPSLSQLDLNWTYLSAQSTTALSHALRSGHCHHLKRLNLAGAFKDHAASLHVLQLIQARGMGTRLARLLVDLGVKEESDDDREDDDDNGSGNHGDNDCEREEGQEEEEDEGEEEEGDVDDDE